MKIESKYEVGDKVWLMKDNQPKHVEIMGMKMEYKEGIWEEIDFCGMLIIFYEMGDKNNSELYYEDEVFGTKEELLNSL